MDADKRRCCRDTAVPFPYRIGMRFCWILPLVAKPHTAPYCRDTAMPCPARDTAPCLYKIGVRFGGELGHGSAVSLQKTQTNSTLQLTDCEHFPTLPATYLHRVPQLAPNSAARRLCRRKFEQFPR